MNLKLFIFCVSSLSVFAATPKMTEFFRYQNPEFSQDFSKGFSPENKDLFVLPTFSVEGKSEIGQQIVSSSIIRPRLDLEPRHRHVLGFEIRIVEDIQPEDLLSTINFAGPAELVQKLQNTAQIGGMNIYIKSGIAWRVNNDLSFIAPYVRGRVAGVAVSYKSPTRWSRD